MVQVVYTARYHLPSQSKRLGHEDFTLSLYSILKAYWLKQSFDYLLVHFFYRQKAAYQTRALGGGGGKGVFFLGSLLARGSDAYH